MQPYMYYFLNHERVASIDKHRTYPPPLDIEKSCSRRTIVSVMFGRDALRRTGTSAHTATLKHNSEPFK